jgi:hypothetical protein
MRKWIQEFNELHAEALKYDTSDKKGIMNDFMKVYSIQHVHPSFFFM